MKHKNKLIIFSFLSLSMFSLSACSVAGIKIIEKADNVQVSKEQEPKTNGEEENVRTFEHAGYVFREVDKTLYTIESAPAMDSLEKDGSIVRSLIPGESVHVIGIDSGKKYAVCKDGENYLYVSMDSLSTKKPSNEKLPEKNEIIDKEELDIAIKEAKDILKEQDIYTEDSITKLRKKIVSAEKVFQDIESSQKDVDSALNALTKAKKGLEKIEEPEEVPAENEETEETEVETEVIEEKVKEYENVLTEDREEYTEESLKAYDEAMGKMKELLKKDKVSASEVKKITMELDRAIAGLKLKKEVDSKAVNNAEGLGIPYPSAPDSVDIYGGVTFAILKNVTATVSTDGKVYELSSAESKEIGQVKSGEKVKVLAIGTNDFARIEFAKGKVGFIKSTYLKKN